MKVTHRKIEKDGEGTIALIAEDADDLWYIYNIIQKNDHLRASTMRKIVNESSTGSTNAHRVKLTLTVAVEKVEYDSESNVVKVKGKNVEENKHVKRGQYHTLDLELNKKFYLTKPLWDSLALSQLNNACDAARNAELAVVIMQEGLAFVCLLTTNMTIQKAKIEVNIPRKRKNFCSQHQKALAEFYEQTLQAMLRYIAWDVIKCILVASPGFVKDQFMEYVWQQANRFQDSPIGKPLLENRGKFLLAHSSTGFKHSIREVLSDPLIQAKLEDTKAVQEVRLWNRFQDLLSSSSSSGESSKAVYGLRDVETANHYEAIDCMMLSDSLFRSSDLALRKKYSQLLYQVKKNGGEVRIFSSMHPTGHQLNQLTGIAAILKFQVPELADRIAAGGVDTCQDSDSSCSSTSSGSDSSSRSLSTSSSSSSSSSSYSFAGDDAAPND